MVTRRDRYTATQGAILIAGLLFSTLASFFLGNYFELGTILFIVWVLIWLFGAMFAFAITDQCQPFEVSQRAMKSMIFCIAAILIISFAHTPLFEGMKKGFAEEMARRQAATSNSASSEETARQCNSQLECDANRFKALASQQCKTELEKQTTTVRWNAYDILSSYTKDKDHPISITYYGDVGEFQVDSGAYQQWTYFCDFDYERLVVMNSGLIFPGSLEKNE